MVKVSISAKEKVSELMSEGGFDPNKDFVRVGVKSGGCSGLSYELKFDKEKDSHYHVKFFLLLAAMLDI